MKSDPSTASRKHTVRWGGWSDGGHAPILKWEGTFPQRARYRCIFCGHYTLAMPELIDHFHASHGRVL